MPPPKSLLLRRRQGLTQSEDADSNPTAQSPPAWGLPGARNWGKEAGGGWSQRFSRAGPALYSGDQGSHRRPTPEARRGGTRGEGAPEHSPPPPRSPASSCPGRAPSPCFPSAPLPALSAVSLCAIRSRRCPRPSDPPRTPETRAAPAGPPAAPPRLRPAPAPPLLLPPRPWRAPSGAPEPGRAGELPLRPSSLRPARPQRGRRSLLGLESTAEARGTSL